MAAPLPEWARSAGSRLALVLGIHRHYQVDLLFSTSALLIAALGVALLPGSLAPGISSALLLATPALVKLWWYVQKLRLMPPRERYRVPRPTVPLYTVIISAVVSGFYPIALPVAALNAAFVEDITAHLTEAEIARIRRGVNATIEPLRRREALLILSASTLPALIAAPRIGPIAFIYPTISYVMMVYSILVTPPEAQARPERPSLREYVSWTIPLLPYLYIMLYRRRRLEQAAREAGLVGGDYFVMVARWAGRFAVATYLSLTLLPVFHLLAQETSPTLLLLPLIPPAATLLIPLTLISVRRRARASSLSRNLLIILTYLAAMYSVSETFKNAMLNLRYNPSLAKLFAMEREYRLFLAILRVVRDEGKAMDEYADTVPNELYRDTVRTAKDLQEMEGPTAVFKSLVERLRDYAYRHVDRVASQFRDQGRAIMSTIVIGEVLAPVIVMVAAPELTPLVVLAAAVATSMLIVTIAASVYPDMPSEYLYLKRRMRYAAAVFGSVGPFTTLALTFLLPQADTMMVVASSFLATLALSVYVAARRDLAINWFMLERMSDILTLFSNAMARYNSVPKSLRELAYSTGTPPLLREEFLRLARVYESAGSSARIVYVGPFWLKYFHFLAGLGARYGVTPRDLYRAISDFMIDYRKFFIEVRNFGRTLLVITILGLVLMTGEVSVMLQFMREISESGIEEAAREAGFALPIDVPDVEELERVSASVQGALLLAAVFAGLPLGKLFSGTVLDGRWPFLLLVVEALAVRVLFSVTVV